MWISKRAIGDRFDHLWCFHLRYLRLNLCFFSSGLALPRPMSRRSRGFSALWGIGYRTADSSQLNAMSEPQLGGYKLAIIPGGNSITIGEDLTAVTSSTIRGAVEDYGVHDLGLCAGALGGYSIYNGVNCGCNDPTPAAFHDQLWSFGVRRGRHNARGQDDNAR
jgi:hypothetical protein